MASTQKTTYFIIALRPIKDSESEADFIFGDETLVIDAVKNALSKISLKARARSRKHSQNIKLW